MKQVINIMCSLLIGVGVIAAGVGSYQNQFNAPQVPADDPMIISEVCELTIEETPECVEVISEVPLIRTTEFVNLTFEEMDLLEQIAIKKIAPNCVSSLTPNPIPSKVLPL